MGDVDGADFSSATCLYVPSLGEETSFESFAEIVAHLRAPNGCPWDREQTHQTLRTHLLEEAYETLSAMDVNDVEAMREEFGDLFLQILLNSQIASEAGEFTITNVIKSINDKLIRRHPHVFGDDENNKTWDELKREEKSELKHSMLDDIITFAPALQVADEVQRKATRTANRGQRDHRLLLPRRAQECCRPRLFDRNVPQQPPASDETCQEKEQMAAFGCGFRS